MQLGRSIRLGAYHDGSLFLDRDDPSVIRAVNAVGPSIHVLLLDSFALDFYWGYGWSPSGPSQNLSLTFKKVY